MLENGICEAKVIEPTQDTYTKVDGFCSRKIAPGRGAPIINTLAIYVSADAPQDDSFIRCIYKYLVDECHENSNQSFKNGVLYFAIVIPAMFLLFQALQYRHKRSPAQRQNAPQDHSDIETNTGFSQRLAKIKENLLALQNEAKESMEIQQLTKDMTVFEEKFQCPGTKPKHLMDIPITMSTGVTYNKKFIVAAFRDNNTTCPKTNKPFSENLNTLPAVDVIIKNDIQRRLQDFEQRIKHLQSPAQTDTALMKKMK